MAAKVLTKLINRETCSFILNVVETGQLKKKKKVGFLFSGRISMKDKAPDCTQFSEEYAI